MATVATISPAPWNRRTAKDVAIVVPPMVARSVRSSTTFR
jgi:hypothetical protein